MLLIDDGLEQANLKFFTVRPAPALGMGERDPNRTLMVNVPPLPEPTAAAVAYDRKRLRYAVLGALALLAGVWIA